jgi:MFS family permease
MKGVEYFLPTYLTLKSFQPLDTETAQTWAATAATLVLASGVPAQWLGGRAADRVGSKKVLITVSAGIVAALLFLQFTPPAFTFVGVAAFIVLYGMSFFGHQPALNSLTGIMTPPERRGAVYGVFFFTSFGLGSLSQAITGYYMNNFGVESSFYFLTVVAVIALFLSLFIPDRRQKRTV